MPDSGIKDFFDIANTMDGALSLGVGEPDFQTPEHVREAAVASIRRAETKYTDNRGTVELRAAAAEYLEKFDLDYLKRLAESDDFRTFFLFATYEGRKIAASMFMVTGKIMQYYM